MRYVINFNKTVSQLIPHYLGGRKLILYLQSTVKPLQTLNNIFVEWAKEKRIESAMTSQTIMLEWFLTRKFKRYFSDTSQAILLAEPKAVGVPFYNENADGIPVSEQAVLMQHGDPNSSATVVLHGENEGVVTADVSFVVRCPKLKLDKNGQNEVLRMMRYWIDRYRIANKTYNILIEE